MSSLRLALKQSLQESAPQHERKGSNDSSRRTHRNRQRSRRSNVSLSRRSEDKSPREKRSSADDGQDGNDSHEFSSENEFAFDDDDEVDDESDRETSKEQSMQPLKLNEQHTAANTIQSRWKHAKTKLLTEQGDLEHQTLKSSSNPTTDIDAVATTVTPATLSPSPKPVRKSTERIANSSSSIVKSKIVPPPSTHLLEWMHDMPVKRSRRNVTPGLRVKVRFATKVKREGKLIRKKKWYGGRVSAVSREGSKIRIKYDDGTTEVTRFPDKDVVVDDTSNGQHHAPYDKFVPPATLGSENAEVQQQSQFYQEEDDEEEEKDNKDEAMLEKAHPQHCDPANPQVMTETSITKVESALPSMERNPSTSASSTLKAESLLRETSDDSASLRSAQSLDVLAKTSSVLDSDDKFRLEADGLEAYQVALPDDDWSKPKRKRGRPPKRGLSGASMSPKLFSNDNIQERDYRALEDTSSAAGDYDSSATKLPTIEECSEYVDGKLSNWTAAKTKGHTECDSVPVISSLSKKQSVVSNKHQYAAHDVLESIGNAGKFANAEIPAIFGEKTNYTSASKNESNSEIEKPVRQPSITLRLPNVTKRKAAVISKVNSDKLDTSQVTAEAKYGLGGNDHIVQDESRSEEDSTLGEESFVQGSLPTDTFEGSHDFVQDHNVVDRPSTKRLHIHIPVSKIAKREGSGSKFAKSELASSKKRIREKEHHGLTNHSSGELNDTEVQAKVSKRKRLEDVNGRNFELNIGSKVINNADPLEAVEFTSNTPFAIHETFETDASPTLSDQLSEQECEHDLEGSAEDVSSAPDDTNPKDGTSMIKSLTPHHKVRHDDAHTTVRSGRLAAQQANDRIASGQDVENEDLASKRKNQERRKEGDNEDSESSEDDSQWVQCDKCKKWRIIPTMVVASLPTQWFCENNEWDLRRANCDVPEQTAKQAAKERKRRKKLQRRLRMEAADSEVISAEVGKKIVPERTASPVSRFESLDDCDKKQRRPSPSEHESGQLSMTVLPSKLEKKGLCKKTRLIDISDGMVAPVDNEGKPRGRGRPRRNAQGKESVGKSISVPSLQSQIDEADNLEWVQCEKCLKWRKLPAHISADELPDTWYCSMNHWSPASASCDAPEDKADGLQDIGYHAGTGVGKLSYRNLIFGQTGRKTHRPMSERARAAESLFLSQTEDKDAPPTVMYANSSNFVSRGRNNMIPEETNNISFFEMMSHSKLWTELRRDTHPYDCHTSSGVRPKQINVAYFTYDTLPGTLKGFFRDLLLHSLGDDILSGEAILLKMLGNARDGEPEGWASVRPYCTLNTVVTAVYGLVKEGFVECINKMEPNAALETCNLRYRRSRFFRAADNTQSIETRGVSRCIKISKPWKRNHAEYDTFAIDA